MRSDRSQPVGELISVTATGTPRAARRVATDAPLKTRTHRSSRKAAAPEAVLDAVAEGALEQAPVDDLAVQPAADEAVVAAPEGESIDAADVESDSAPDAADDTSSAAARAAAAADVEEEESGPLQADLDEAVVSADLVRV